MLRTKLIFCAAAAALTGCVTVYDKSDMVMKRAEFDLGCADGHLSVREIGPNAFGAEGCGRRASYVVLCPGFLTASCTPLLDSGQAGSGAAVSLLE